jgi:hypothetical protein
VLPISGCQGSTALDMSIRVEFSFAVREMHRGLGSPLKRKKVKKKNSETRIIS